MYVKNIEIIQKIENILYIIYVDYKKYMFYEDYFHVDHVINFYIVESSNVYFNLEYPFYYKEVIDFFCPLHY